MLGSGETNFFRKLLGDQLKELTERGDETIGEMGSSRDQFADPGDRAASEANDVRDLRIRDLERKMIAKLKEALERLDAGIYGICEECEEQIGVERLKARPVTTLCIECKQRQEEMEKQRKV